MAPVRAILGALWTATRRSRKSLLAFSGNNLSHAGFALLFFHDPGAFILVLVIIGLVVFLPMSGDPLRQVPPERLAIWPLASSERRLLRILSPWLSPVIWMLAALAVWKKLTLGLWAVLAGLFAVGFVIPSIPVGACIHAWRRVPQFPGQLDQLIRKNVREILSTLDFYGGLVVVVPALIFRAKGLLPAQAYFPLTIVVMLTISTYAQCLFGLDGEGGLTRYRLLPLPGWQILAAKDAAFLLITLALTLPLSPIGGLAAALAALAVGHRASITEQRAQVRWRFHSGVTLGDSLLQIVPMIMAAAGAEYASPLLLAPCLAACAWSTWWFGRVLERKPA